MSTPPPGKGSAKQIRTPAARVEAAMMTPTHHRLPDTRLRGGFSLLELVVAIVVLGFAFMGLFPLVVVLSRDLQPQGTRLTPAKNFEGSSSRRIATWYVTPFVNPWERKLGASARIGSDQDAFDAYSPASIHAALIEHNDYNDGRDTDGDSVADYADGGWDYVTGDAYAWQADYHRYDALAAGTPSSNYAVWTFKINAAGWYSIQTTWTASGDYVNDAQCNVLKNGATLVSKVVNQQLAPNQQTSVGYITDADGRGWAQLSDGMVQLAAGDTVTVQLSIVRATSIEIDKKVVADGARLVRKNDVAVNTFTRNPNAESAGANVSVTVRLPQ
jgi:prepilin-type N-terminal cleavage/methylation domain-containing protein